MANVLRSCRSRGDSDVTATSASSVTSYGSSVTQSDRSLLFGEISQSPSGQSFFSKTSTCNLVLSSSSTFLSFWLSENCRNTFLNHVDRDTLPALRLVCNNFAATTAASCFREIDITFRTNVFKPSRILSLNRIGRHVKKLNFNVPHSSESFLPPLIDQNSGEQMSFDYTPQIETERTREPKYGSWEMTDLLIQQYPPIFHAATNIPSFIRALASMPNIEHLTIFSPDQNMSPQYRRSVADYTLVSLRIAMERAPLAVLNQLSLQAIHPAALLHLQPVLSVGSTPSSCRRWTQINHLSIEMDSTPFLHHKSNENLRILQAYMRAFCTSLTHLSFKWTGMSKGPSPVSSDVERTKASGSHLSSSASSCTPTSSKLRRTKSVRFFNLRYLTLQSAFMNSEQVAMFITNHRATLKEFNFEDVSLTQGSWQTTLDPLRELKRTERSKTRLQHAALDRSLASVHPVSILGVDEMYVPCKLSPLDFPETEPVIEGTLEPQECEMVQASSWFGKLVKGRRPKRTQDKSLSNHLRRVMHILPWK